VSNLVTANAILQADPLGWSNDLNDARNAAVCWITDPLPDGTPRKVVAMDVQRVYKCADSACPGRLFKASDRPHQGCAR